MPAASVPYMDSVLAGIQGTSKLLSLGWDASLAPTFFLAFQILVLSSYQHLSLSRIWVVIIGLLRLKSSKIVQKNPLL